MDGSVNGFKGAYASQNPVGYRTLYLLPNAPNNRHLLITQLPHTRVGSNLAPAAPPKRFPVECENQANPVSCFPNSSNSHMTKKMLSSQRNVDLDDKKKKKFNTITFHSDFHAKLSKYGYAARHENTHVLFSFDQNGPIHSYQMYFDIVLKDDKLSALQFKVYKNLQQQQHPSFPKNLLKNWSHVDAFLQFFTGVDFDLCNLSERTTKGDSVRRFPLDTENERQPQIQSVGTPVTRQVEEVEQEALIDGNESEAYDDNAYSTDGEDDEPSNVIIRDDMMANSSPKSESKISSDGVTRDYTLELEDTLKTCDSMSKTKTSLEHSGKIKTSRSNTELDAGVKSQNLVDGMAHKEVKEEPCDVDEHFDSDVISNDASVCPDGSGLQHKTSTEKTIQRFKTSDESRLLTRSSFCVELDIAEDGREQEGEDDDQQNSNTLRKTSADLRLFRQFLDFEDERRRAEQIPPDDLDRILSRFILSVRKVNGEEYEPVTIKSFICSIDRYLRSKKYPVNIMTGSEFSKTRRTLRAKSKLLKSMGKGNKPKTSSTLSDEQIKELWANGQLGDHDPHSIINTLWLYNAIGFGLRRCEDHRTMTWGDVVLGEDEDGHLFMELNKRQNKTKDKHPKIKPKIWANFSNPNRCPVRCFQKYKALRPDGFSNPEDPFYIATTTKHNFNFNPDTDQWFKKQPVGINKLNSLMKNMAQTLSNPQTLTNRSARKFLMQNLVDHDVPPTEIMQISGHKNVGSVNQYRNLNKAQHKRISAMIYNENEKDDIPSLKRQKSDSSNSATVTS